MDYGSPAFRLGKGGFGYPHFRQGGGVAFGAGGGGSRIRAVSGRTFYSDEDGGSSNRYVRSTEWHPVFHRLTGRLIVHWPNYFISNTATGGGGKEVGTGGTLSMQAKISYYDATTNQLTTVAFKQLSDDGATISCADGAEAIGYVDIDAKAGQHMYFDTAIDFAGGMAFMQNVADRNNGDVFQFGTSFLNGSTDLATMLATTPSNSAFVTLAGYYACRIRMVSSVPAYGILGDSIDRGYLDTANDAWGATGAWGRVIGKRAPYLNASRSGEMSSDFKTEANNPHRVAALREDIDVLLIGTGINGLYFNSQSAATVDADNTAIATLVGKPAVRRTLWPVINYPANTVNNVAGEARRVAYNALVKAAAVYYDPCSTVESVGTPGTLNNIAYVTSDGTHPSNTGNEAPIGNASALAFIAAYSVPAQLTFSPWDINNLDSATVAAWLHPSDYAVGSWTARTGASAVQGTGANQPSIASGGGADLTSTKWLTSTLTSSDEDEYFAALVIPAAVSGNQTIAGSSGSGRQLRLSGSTVLTLNKQGSAQRTGVTVSPVFTANPIVIEKVDANPGNIALGVDGKNYATGDSGSSQPYVAGQTTFYGRTGGGAETFTGVLREVVVLNSAPSAAIRNRIAARLHWRNGSQARLDAGNPYTATPPTL